MVRDKLGIADDAAHDFSAKVECTNGGSIIAERPMYFNYKGVWTGGHDVAGFAPQQERTQGAARRCDMGKSGPAQLFSDFLDLGRDNDLAVRLAGVLFIVSPVVFLSGIK